MRHPFTETDPLHLDVEIVRSTTVLPARWQHYVFVPSEDKTVTRTAFLTTINIWQENVSHLHTWYQYIYPCPSARKLCYVFVFCFSISILVPVHANYVFWIELPRERFDNMITVITRMIVKQNSQSKLAVTWAPFQYPIRRLILRSRLEAARLVV